MINSNFVRFIFCIIAVVIHPLSSVLAETQKVNSTQYDYGFELNDNGQAVWFSQESFGMSRTLYLYDRDHEIKIADTNYWARAAVNNSGTVVWTDGFQVYLYDNEVNVPISTPYSLVNEVQINDQGSIAWQTDRHVYLYQNGVVQQITPNYESFNLLGDLNNKNQVTYNAMRFPESDFEIYLYDSGLTYQLTNNSFNEANGQMNDRGQIVWPVDLGLAFYDSGMITQIEDSYVFEYYPQISETGSVAWVARDEPGFFNVYLYENNIVRNLSNDFKGNFLQDMNGKGQVIWRSGSRFYFYDGVSIQDVTPEADTLFFSARISDSGQIAYLNSNSIYLTDYPKNNTAQPVPEPSTLLLLGAGIPALAWMKRRKKT